MSNLSLNDADRHDITAFVERVLAAHVAGALERAAAVGALTATMFALGAGDLTQARAWYEESTHPPSQGAR